MKLEEFYMEEQARVLSFKMAWMKAHHQAPNVFPLDMEPGDWDAQLADFNGEEFVIPEGANEA